MTCCFFAVSTQSVTVMIVVVAVQVVPLRRVAGYQLLIIFTDQFSETSSHLLEKHAPKQTKTTQLRPPSPWMSLEIILAKRRRRYPERVWRRTRSPLDRFHYSNQLHLCNRVMSKSKSDYYTSLLSNNSDNTRHMWNSVNIKFSPREIQTTAWSHFSGYTVRLFF